MNVSSRLGIAILLIGSLAAVAAAPRGSRTGQWAADLEVVADLLARDRSFSADSRTQAEARLRDLRARADHLGAAAFQLEVARLFALARNGHTMLVAGLWPSRFPSIAAHTQVFADGVFIVAADDRRLMGQQVLALDGRSVDELRTRFGDYWGAVPPRRDEWLGYWIESPELLHAAGLADRPDRITLQLLDRQGAVRRVALRASRRPPAHGRYAFFSRARLVDHAQANLVAGARLPRYLAEPDTFFRYEFLADLNASYVQLRYNQHVGNQRLDTFAAAALDAVRRDGPDHLIVDLRLDAGGDLNHTRELMQALPGFVPPGGRIFAITSGRTFSAGIASLGYLKQAGGDRVVIVGEEVGDRLEYWAEGPLVALPETGAEVLIATERHNYRTGCPEADCHEPIRRHPIRVASLAPDIVAPLRYEDYRRGVDPALAAITALIR